MKRILLMLLRNLFYLPIGFGKLYYMAAHVDKYPEEERYKHLKDIVKHANEREHPVLILQKKQPKGELGQIYTRVMKAYAKITWNCKYK